MQNVLIVDTETNGVDPDVNDCIEIAAVLYSLEHNTPLASAATLIYADENRQESVNHTPQAALFSAMVISHPILAAIASMADKADVVIAHSKEFDKAFASQVLPEIRKKPWVCSCYEIDWPSTPASSKGIKLAHLAIAEGIPVVPNQLHRALADVELLVAIMQQTPDMATRIKDAMSPRVKLIANVEFAQKDLAKEAGFRWDGKEKYWHATVPVSKVAEFKERLAFPVTEVSL